MKYNKIALWVSITVTAICLIAYSCFGYIPCLKNNFIKDVALALLGSAALVIATSLVGYFVERSHLQRKIIDSVLNMNMIEEVYRENGTNGITIKNGVKVIRTIVDRVKICYYYMKQYKEGSFKQDKTLSEILSKDFPQYVQGLKDLESFTRTVKITQDNIIVQEKPGEEEKKLREKIFSWMKKCGFDFDENFEKDIIEDEKEQEKND